MYETIGRKNYFWRSAQDLSLWYNENCFLDKSTMMEVSMIFDTHTHYDDEQFHSDRDELITSLENAGIGTIVNIGSSIQTTKNSIDLAEKYPNIYAAVGVHPSESAELNEEKFLWLEKIASHKKVVAIGEIGLDYYWDEPDREIQKKWFKQQMELAIKLGLPVVIHSRDAAADTLDMIRKACNVAYISGQKLKGVMHCFSYGPEIAEQYLKLGFYFGIGGVVTFKNAKKTKEVVKMLPMDHILVETDCPYLAPDPNRGKRNSSLNLSYIIEEIARIKDISKEEVIHITEKNAYQMYQLNQISLEGM